MSDIEFENLLDRVGILESDLDDIYERLDKLEGDDDSASSIRDEIEDLPDEDDDQDDDQVDDQDDDDDDE